MVFFRRRQGSIQKGDGRDSAVMAEFLASGN